MIQRDRDISVRVSTAEADCVDFLPTWACLSVSADPYKQHGCAGLLLSLTPASEPSVHRSIVSREDGRGGHSSLSALPAWSIC